MKSVTEFLRRKGYPLREISQLLRRLQPTEGHAALGLGGGSALEEVLRQLQNDMQAEGLAQSRSSLSEAGIEPRIEHQHTLMVPLSTKDFVDRSG
jgi:hypothetical protein